jgi:hypothetical protein
MIDSTEKALKNFAVPAMSRPRAIKRMTQNIS